MDDPSQQHGNGGGETQAEAVGGSAPRALTSAATTESYDLTAAGVSRTRPWPAISPNSTSRGEPPPRARQRRWPWHAFRPVSSASRSPAGESTARVLAGYRRTAVGRGRGQTSPFVAADLATVLATCHWSRRRVEADEVALEARTARRR